MNINNTHGTLGSSTSTLAKKRRVLIVDDEEDITKVFKIGLEGHEFEVVTFNDPKDALLSFQPGRFDLLILDIRMPGMNGFELYSHLRTIDQKAKVCFLTAFDEYRDEFKKEFPFLDEVKCFLKKPITLNDMIKRLLVLLE